MRAATGWPYSGELSPSPSDRCRAALIDDATRSNTEIALAARSTPDQAASVRRALEARAVIPPHRAPPPARFPEHVPFPRSPRVLQEGLCVAAGHPPPDAWAEPRHPDRELARMLCREACHVQAICLEWALAAVPHSDTAVYAGTTRSQRAVLRRQRGYPASPLSGVPLINSRKTCCPACGLPLAGENLITEPGRRPGTVRRRCRACTKRRKHAAHAAAREAAAAHRDTA
jgi:transcription factor WhiB